MLLDLSDHLLDTKVIAPKIFYKEELASTNEKALNLNNNSYGIVICDKQTYGRGRHGRKWISTPYKDLAFTIIIPKNYIMDGQSLVNIACRSIVITLEKLKIFARIKHPNDIYIDNKKISGILCEQIVKDKVITQVLGIGINVNSNFQDLEPIQDKLYTSLLLELGKKVSREKLLRNLIETIDQTIQKQIRL
ncbi:MAG: biotin--[acetyl-CoA-carboxylase] ligase [Candidatus Neomarinimicrobiota bacterium]|nr:biotin--[acetyl-CoA-carboxylase] ligase [Candidatus Neomarinimicrobiota bacterium]